MREPSKFVYKSTLRKVYGLTPSMIEELGEPDKYRTNPHWQGAPDASLYSVARIEVWVRANRERVERARASRAKRSAAAQAVQERKREERRRETEKRRRDALEWANGLVVKVERRLPTRWSKTPGAPTRSLWRRRSVPTSGTTSRTTTRPGVSCTVTSFGVSWTA